MKCIIIIKHIRNTNLKNISSEKYIENRLYNSLKNKFKIYSQVEKNNKTIDLLVDDKIGIEINY